LRTGWSHGKKYESNSHDQSPKPGIPLRHCLHGTGYTGASRVNKEEFGCARAACRQSSFGRDPARLFQ
jgi:hypothetical protein